MDLISLVKQTIPLARKAGKAILSVYESGADMQVEQKSDDSPLTIADKKSNQVICDGLELLSHRFPIISEENKQVDYEVRKNYEYYWLIDPLDGTKEFIKRNGEFTVNIALIKGQEVVLGIVYVPCLDEMYWAAKGEGAWLVKTKGAEKLKVSHFRMTDAQLRVVSSRSHQNEATKNFVEALLEPVLLSKGSSLKFLILAKGEADLYPRMSPTMEWDTAAAQIVLEEAGGRVIDENTGQEMRYNKKQMMNAYFVGYGHVLQ